MATLDSIQPYVEQLFDDDEVRTQLARANANLRAARARAGRTKSTKKALKDERLRQRVMASVQALGTAAAEIKAAPEKQRRRARRRRLLVLLFAAVSAGAFFALSEEARGRLLAMARSGKDQPQPQ